ncbi:hypothetical protein [Nocardioides euryhalodurans]|uniref:Uncharacterized protein n=1 Tax=Nocardioides euryhalodurans TaxID=2518370 RepID=A0A4P7GMJ4_9ACTN|nr:hypothetical protein [Nocardioides euryhalodurans]QBR93356.1 hypothetical protein EXE57_14605 [Nocardioides euryhalodurans]
MRGTTITWWELERPGLTMPVRTDPTGRSGPTPGQARGPRWRTTSRGLRVPADVDDSVVEQRIVEAAAVLPREGGVSGWAGLRWYGGHWFDGLGGDGLTRLPVTLATGDSTIVAQPGFEISEEHLRPYDVVLVDGMPVTIPLRSVTYLARYAADWRDAVVAIDMAAYHDLVSTAEVRRYQETLPAWTGIGQCRKATAHADENAWSPREVRTRLVWTEDAELPRPWTNRPVFDRWGTMVGTPDLLDEEAGVAVDYDGAVHLVGSQRRRDRDREEAFRRVGIEYLTVLAGDRDRGHLAARMREVRSRARWAAPSQRPWTIEPPRWWVPTWTVEQRRNLTDAERERLLRIRRTA